MLKLDQNHHESLDKHIFFLFFLYFSLAASDSTPEPNVREGRQGIFLPSREDILASYNEDLASNPLLTGPCFTSKGSLGRCMSFRQCYPYFKLPDLNNWDSWILGMYDTCSYFTAQGRQVSS